MPRGRAEEQRLKRAAGIRKRITEAKKNPGVIVVGNRNVYIRQPRTDTCQQPGCIKEFTYVMTTRRRQYCPECAVIRDKERRNRTRTPKRSAPADEPRQVRYAGYDPSERSLEELENAESSREY